MSVSNPLGNLSSPFVSRHPSDRITPENSFVKGGKRQEIVSRLFSSAQYPQRPQFKSCKFPKMKTKLQKVKGRGEEWTIIQDGTIGRALILPTGTITTCQYGALFSHKTCIFSTQIYICGKVWNIRNVHSMRHVHTCKMARAKYWQILQKILKLTSKWCYSPMFFSQKCYQLIFEVNLD